MQTVKKAAPSGLPIIVVLMSGGAVDISQASVSFENIYCIIYCICFIILINFNRSYCYYIYLLAMLLI